MSISYPVVKTNSGSVKGISRKTDTGKLYYSFQHVPYVQQPKGVLRFKDPRAVQPWTETLDCTKEGSTCYMFDTFKTGLPEFFGSDDCLGVNVFTPNVRIIYLLNYKNNFKVKFDRLLAQTMETFARLRLDSWWWICHW